MKANAATLSTDTVLALLADRRRRRVLDYLRDHGAGSASLEELVSHLAGDDGSPARERLGLSLRHVHLPKLAEAGVLDYDREAGRVRYRPEERVERVLRVVTSELD